MRAARASGVIAIVAGGVGFATSCGMRARHGISLLETVVAAGLLATVLTGIVPLATVAVTAASRARAQVLAEQLARQRVEQLEALTHMRTGAGVISDVDTRLDGPDFVSGGPGLTPAGVSTLDADTAAWCDLLDEHGTALGACDAASPGARFARRWAVQAMDDVDGCVRLWAEVRAMPPRRGLVAAQAGAVRCAWSAVRP